MGLEDEMAATLPNLATRARARMLAAALRRARIVPRTLPRTSFSTRAMSSPPAEASSASVKTPREVLSFWFGEDAYFGDAPELATHFVDESGTSESIEACKR